MAILIISVCQLVCVLCDMCVIVELLENSL